MPADRLLAFAPNDKQRLFFTARERYVAYGGAGGGGKSWAVRVKAVLLALYYPGIRVLVVRRSYAELEENHVRPMQTVLDGIALYRDRDKTFSFPAGSRIRFGYCDNEGDVLRYQGQEFDCVFLDEATQLTEFQFQTFKGCLRGVNDFPKRMYITCNPGGVGHAWVKRLFIDRDFRAGEDPGDYVFIPAGVRDNRVLMEKDPEYVRRLESLPYALRKAWLEGSWDVFAGQFFTEWDRRLHVCRPFSVPPRLAAVRHHGLRHGHAGGVSDCRGPAGPGLRGLRGLRGPGSGGEPPGADHFPGGGEAPGAGGRDGGIRVACSAGSVERPAGDRPGAWRIFLPNRASG